jgi:prepilin-type N-terminal cleavage/methylation domain-containing protein
MQVLMKKNKGFTLIEVVVVMGVFLFIIGAAMGIFLSVVQNQKKVLAEQQLINQVSYIEEYMSKALRMAAADSAGRCMSLAGSVDIPIKYIYLLTRLDGEQYGGIRFLNQSSGDCQEFFLDKSDITMPILKELKGTSGNVNVDDGAAVDITSSGIQIDDIKFSVNGKDGTVSGQDCNSDPTKCGTTNADDIQPKVTILIDILIPISNGASCAVNPCTITGQKCYLSTNKCATVRTIQTTVSQRNLNVK